MPNRFIEIEQEWLPVQVTDIERQERRLLVEALLLSHAQIVRLVAVGQVKDDNAGLLANAVCKELLILIGDLLHVDPAWAQAFLLDGSRAEIEEEIHIILEQMER